MGKKASINVGSEKQLFIDNMFIDESKGITLTMNQPAKTGERLIVIDKPWEDWFIAGCSVILDDDGIFKMWYGAWDKRIKEELKKEGSMLYGSLCYAVSKDGVHWEKPVLGLLDYTGSKKNNIVFQQGSGIESGVFKDPNAPAKERYKLLYSDRRYPWKAPKPYGTYATICGAVSPDGILWTPLKENPIMDWYCDTMNVAFWDDSIKKYVAYLRDDDWTVKDKDRFRRIGRSETDDFSHWPRPKMVLAPDDEDPVQTDLYNSAAIKYPYAANAYFMFPSPFYHKFDTVDIQCAVSRDGKVWERAGGRKPFIPIGMEGDFDCPQVYAGAGITRKGDEISIYYYGNNVGHDATSHKEFDAVYSRAVLRLDGFISADVDYHGGVLTTPVLIFNGNRLELNVNTSAGGSVHVEILDKEGSPTGGFTRADADVVNGNSVHKTVTWKGNPDVRSLANKPVRLKFSMRDTKLYAFQFVA